MSIHSIHRIHKAIAELEEALQAAIDAPEGTPLDASFEGLNYSVMLLRAIAKCIDGDPTTLRALAKLADEAKAAKTV